MRFVLIHFVGDQNKRKDRAFLGPVKNVDLSANKYNFLSYEVKTTLLPFTMLERSS